MNTSEKSAFKNKVHCKCTLHMLVNRGYSPSRYKTKERTNEWFGEWKKKIFVRYLLPPSTEQISIFNRLFQEHYQNVKIFHFYLYAEKQKKKRRNSRDQNSAISGQCNTRRWPNTKISFHLQFYLYFFKCNGKFSRENLRLLKGRKKEQGTPYNQFQKQQHGHTDRQWKNWEKTKKKPSNIEKCVRTFRIRAMHLVSTA